MGNRDATGREIISAVERYPISPYYTAAKTSGTGDQCTFIAVLPSVVAVTSEGGRSGAKTYRNERAKCRLHLIKWEIPFTSDSYNEKFFLLFIYLCLSIERVLSIEGLSCRKETPARVRVNVSTSPRHAR